MKNKKILLIILIIIIAIIGISVFKLKEKDKHVDNTEVTETVQGEQQDYYLTENNNQNKNTYESPVKVETNNITDGTDNQNNEHIGEIELANEDNSVTYSIIDEKSIKYKGTTYQDLYSCINSIPSKYSTNTIINFIIKTYKSSSDLVYVDVITDEVNTGEGDSVDFTLDEELQGYNKYESIKRKYDNKPVTWKLTFTDSKTMYPTYIYGCETYMLMTGTNGDIQIDMSVYDSGLNIYQSDQPVETENTEPVETENTEETTEQVEQEDANIMLD